jgi:hypothetical protein
MIGWMVTLYRLSLCCALVSVGFQLFSPWQEGTGSAGAFALATAGPNPSRQCAAVTSRLDTSHWRS